MKIKFALLLTTILLLVDATQAAIISFGFTGKVRSVSNPSNSLPNGVTVGAPITGIITYNTALAMPDSNAGSDIGYYNFTNMAGLAMVVQAGGHTFTGFASKTNSMRIVTFNDYFGADTFQVVGGLLGANAVLVDGQPSAPGTAGQILLNLRDTNHLAYATDALPTTVPHLSVFQNDPYCTVSLVSSGGGTMHSFTVSIKDITPEQQVTLNYQSLPNKMMKVSWPALATGFVLQMRNSLTSGTWETPPVIINDTETEHSYTQATTTGNLFMRLKK